MRQIFLNQLFTLKQKFIMKKVLFLLIVALVSVLSFGPAMYAQSSTDFDKKTFVKSVVDASDADKLALENIKAANS